MKKLKSIGAVLGGFVVVAILSVVTDAILERVGIFPPQTTPEAYAQWMLAVALAYRSVFTILGGYLTARWAPSNPGKHVFVLMILGLIGGVLGAAANWNLGNHWYPVALAVTGPLFVLLGGKLYHPKFSRTLDGEKAV
jgi:MFS family permease